jgi:hypothetical protein
VKRAVCVLGAAICALPGCKGGVEQGKAAASAAPVASVAPAAKTVRLDRRPATIGETHHATRASELSLSVEFWQEGEKLGTTDSTRKESYDRTLRVEGLVGGTPAKASVRYHKYTWQETASGKAPIDSSVLQGKTYALDATEGKLQISDAGGKAVSSEEAAQLRKLHTDLGKDDPVVAAIGDATLTVGQPLTMGRELLRALLTSESGKLKAGRIWFEEIRSVGGRDAIVLKWTADTQSEGENGLQITWHVNGTAVVAISPAMTLEMSIKGALDVSGETTQRGARVTLAGAGSMSDESTLSVTAP